MTTKIQQWGNSLALRIPKSFAEEVRLGRGAEVSLSIDRGRLIVKASPKKSRPTLSALLKKINKSNLHSEVSSGRPAGREAW